LHFIHRNKTVENTTTIRESIFWGGNFESLLFLDDTRQIETSDIKFFLGYSGWGPGQLETELSQDSWIVCDYVTEELLFETNSDEVWKKALANMGGRY